MRNCTASEPRYVYQMFAGSQKIGITVACNAQTALLQAVRATTRKTVSKMDADCDYEELSVRLFGDKGEATVLTMQTALASQEQCNTFGQVEMPGQGVLTFETQRYMKGDAPLAIQAWLQNDEGFPSPWGRITSACPPGSKVESDEIIVKTYDENEQMRSPLLTSGYFADTGKRIPAGYASLEVWKLLPKFVDDFRCMNPHWSRHAV